jgi:cystathionine gamma-synthase
MANQGEYAPDTLAVHADDVMNSYSDVAPALHVSTTFRYDNSNLVPISDEEVFLCSFSLLLTIFINGI